MNARCSQALGHNKCRMHVSAVKNRRICNRFCNQGLRGEMENNIDLPLFQNSRELSLIPDVGLVEPRFSGHGLKVTGGQIVDNGYLVPTAYEVGSAD
jgi:hypothetical protein